MSEASAEIVAEESAATLTALDTRHLAFTDLMVLGPREPTSTELSGSGGPVGWGRDLFVARVILVPALRLHRHIGPSWA